MSASPPSSGTRQQLFLLVLLAGVVIVVALQLAQTFRPRDDVALKVGMAAPPITGEGWVNGTPLASQDLQGRVYVVEAFAYWCGPCIAESRRLVRLHEQYGDRVLFVGMTEEGHESLPETQAFLRAHDVPWPVAYGAVPSLLAWGAEGYPTVWLVGADGKVAWNYASREPLADAIEAALAESAAPAVSAREAPGR